MYCDLGNVDVPFICVGIYALCLPNYLLQNAASMAEFILNLMRVMNVHYKHWLSCICYNDV